MNATRFAELLTEGVHRIRLREGKSIAIVQDELGYALGRQGGASVEFWRKGNIPPRMADVEELARMLTTRARLDRRWLEAFLKSGDHPAPAVFAEAFFAEASFAAEGAPQTATAPAASSAASTAEARVDKPPPPLKLPLTRLPDVGELPLSSVMPYGRNPLFVGRADALQEIAQLLESQRGADPAVIPTVAITGIGGVGKTQMASEFVYRYGRWFKGGVFWLNCDNEAQMVESIAACGRAGALAIGGDFANQSTHEQAAQVLAKWHEPAHRLLIFNNCEEPALLRKWRPRSGGARVLITARRSEWEPVLGVQTYRAAMLARADSISLLRSYGNAYADEALDAVARELGDLPLALHLAGSYLHRFRRVLTPARYLELLREQELILHQSMQSAPLSATDHQWNLQSAFALSASQLDPAQATDAIALEILRVLAVLAPDDLLERTCLLLCLRLVESGRQAESAMRLDDVLRVEEALARLQELGLAMLEDAAGDPAPATAERQSTYAVHTHRLIGSFTRATETDGVQQARARVEEVLMREFQRIDDDGQHLSMNAWRSHMHHVVVTALLRADGEAATLSYWYGRFAWQRGDFQLAERFLEQALALRVAIFGQHSLEAAQARHFLALVQARNNKLAIARQNLEEVLAIRMALLGEADIQIADTLADLGSIDASERLMTDAVSRLEQAFAICQQLGQEESLVMAQVAGDLALYLMGDRAQRVRTFHLLEIALRIRRQQLGAAHPYTTRSQATYGYVLQQDGRYADARREFKAVLQARLATHAPEHWDVGHSRFLLGSLASQQGDWQEAYDQLREAMRIGGLAGDGDDLLIIACQNDLGMVLLADGQSANALQALHQVVRVRESIFRQAHPDLLDTLLRFMLAAAVASDDGLLGAALGRAAELADVLGSDLLVRLEELADRLQRLAASRSNAPDIEAAKHRCLSMLQFMLALPADSLPLHTDQSVTSSSAV